MTTVRLSRVGLASPTTGKVRLARAGLTGGAVAAPVPVVRLSRAGLTGSAVAAPVPVVRLSRAGLTGAAPGATGPKVRLARVGLVGGSPGAAAPKVRLARVGLISGGRPSAAVPNKPAGLDSGVDFTLVATDAPGTNPIASRRWYDGTAGSGTVISTTNTVTVRMPVVTADAQVIYTYQVTDNQGLDIQVTVLIVVRRATIQMKNPDGSFTGMVIRRILTAPAQPAGFGNNFGSNFGT